MGLYPRPIVEYLAAASIPRGPNSRIFCVDPDDGDDNWLGDRWLKPVKSLPVAYAKTVADRHDTVLFIGKDSADTLTETLAWDKDFTHLIGLSADLPGLGQRCRVTGGTETDLTEVITFGGKGNIVKNMQFSNGADADVDQGAVVITGDRLAFENCFIHGMGHVTPAARAGSYSLKLNGAHENFFKNCQIGHTTVLRASTNAELVIVGGSSSNIFRQCRLVTYTETAGHFLLSLTATGGGSGILTMEDCLFYSMSENMAAFIDNAINYVVGGTALIDLCRCRAIGCTGWADVPTYVYTADPTPSVTAGLVTTPTT